MSAAANANAIMAGDLIRAAVQAERKRCAGLLRKLAHDEAVKAQKAGAGARVYRRQGNGEEFVKHLATQDICAAAATLLTEAAAEVEKEPGS
jgi:hypothetical protein